MFLAICLWRLRLFWENFSSLSLAQQLLVNTLIMFDLFLNWRLVTFIPFGSLIIVIIDNVNGLKERSVRRGRFSSIEGSVILIIDDL